MKKMTPEELEKFVHQQLRGLPARRAPNSLESRVLAAIEQQAVIPWYHKSWSYWPTAIRTAFVVLATAVTGAVVAAFYSGFNEVNTSAVVAQAGERLSFFTKLYHVATWIAGVSSQLVATIPPLWLYGGLATIAVLYATFFGLGAAAYRTLYRNH
jgi:hypothetical protein